MADRHCSCSKRCRRRRLPRLWFVCTVGSGTCVRRYNSGFSASLEALLSGSAGGSSFLPSLLALAGVVWGGREVQRAALWLSGCRPPTVFGLRFPPFMISQTFFEFHLAFFTRLSLPLSQQQCWLTEKQQKQKLRTTLNGGSLGSCVDEERS